MVTEEEIRVMFGYKNVKSYTNSIKNKKGIEELIKTLSQRLNDKHQRELKALKEDIISHIKAL